ncbi:unnamed protein product [Discula destructiva]
MSSGSTPRPLSEISPSEKRRNSPSWNSSIPTKKMAPSTDSSPFQSSPLESSNSPRLFWQNRNTENSVYGRGSPSPTRRGSIERLQKASRVKNSNILALEAKHEYDPTKIPQIERPLSKVQGNAFGGTGISGYRDNKAFAHARSESQTRIPIFSPTSSPSITRTPPLATRSPPPNGPRPASREPGSPTKSSLRFRSSDDGPDDDDISWDGRELPSGKALQRFAKSVTFDAGPPEVNEYEMATPDISSIASSERSYDSADEDDYDEDHYFTGVNFDRDDESFDATLEDTMQTPVVLPDDWRQHMDNPSEDGLGSSSMSEGLPSFAPGGSLQQDRSDSRNSNGDHRPLPPLPPPSGIDSNDGRRNSTSSLSATAERMIGAQRNLPTPPLASSFSKSDIQSIAGNGKMTLEERLKLMMLSDDGKSAAELQRERRLRRGTRDRADSQATELDAQDDDEVAGEEDDTLGDLGEYQLPPQISRESILRRVDGNKAGRESDYNFSSPPSSPERPLPLDPDVPIPSTEDQTLDVDDSPVHMKQEADDGDSIIDQYRSESEAEDAACGTQEDADKTDDSASYYSSPAQAPTPEDEMEKEEKLDEDKVTTPRALSPEEKEASPISIKERLDGSVSSKHNPFTDDIQSFMLPKPTEFEATKAADAQDLQQPPSTPKQLTSKPEYDGSGWGEPDEYEDDEESETGSVIHRPLPEAEEEEVRVSPVIPEDAATIKSASGSKLKTRPSATPADLETMREQRRIVSREVPGFPIIPERHQSRLPKTYEDQALLAPGPLSDDYMMRHPSFKSRSLTLDLDLGLSLDQDFDRVIEAQKRGYLMRQNTKVVTASDKDNEDARPSSRSAGNSPVKQHRPQSWTVEPWNGQVRKKSIRKRPVPGAVPPLPGRETNTTAMGSVAEEEVATDATAEDSGERGRLFVKVLGVKDLDLPIPKNERTWFSLTLDNGVHCVTTAWLELARNAPIGQEFELVVPNDLEFQLTLNVKLEKPPPQRIVQSQSSPRKAKTSTFSRVFASPKKRKELELRQKEEDERMARQQRETQAKQMAANPTAWDLLSPLAAEDGSFARAYVCLKEHEARCFGRSYVADVPCFNEWAIEEAAFASSVKSKRGSNSVVRKAPYKIGKLELQLLFVPRPKGATDDDMPRSMNSCIREMKAAEERRARNHEGALSQQGGDCPYWRRRYFKLAGTRLTAYHEATRQPRATINLANAKRLIDDRQALTEKETTGKNGKRRRSAFASDEEGYMFVEEGFRIRFNNGEVIDFYADNAEEKDGWMKALTDVVGRESLGNDDEVHGGSRSKGKWCEMVLKREDTLRRRAEGRLPSHNRTKSAIV